MRKTILPYVVWLAILIALVLLFHPKGVLAESFSMTDQEGNIVRLLDEPCYSAPPLDGLEEGVSSLARQRLRGVLARV